ncbi:uncharacterized protein LOC108682321 [Hyalella azteca]|uniref:Uncharacterized protein LOC108682321 n=1 Tax=Hyalella azteca TaxID=294128 RepID=A0A8B7PLA3_HYAAZ|nr:uncharacterized protein LOC108682321 [Hyalella azteca]
MATDNTHDSNDEADAPQPSKKAQLEKTVPTKEETNLLNTSRRRSTRSVQRYGHSEEETSATAEEDADDLDLPTLPDSDDDPDFAPVDKKESASLSQFSFKTRGRGKGRGSPGGGRGKHLESASLSQFSFKTRGRGRGRGSSGGGRGRGPIISGKLQGNENKTSSVGRGSARKLNPPPSSAASQPKSNAAKTHDNNNKADTADSNRTKGLLTGTSFLMSPSKLSSAINYPPLKRQTQAVRLPEGPTLTPEQLKEIEAQFKSGDFVMAKKDAELENPPIWRIDGKSLLQKFQAFEKDGKVLYRNISTYSGWTSQGKALYMPVKAKFIFQSRYDIVVELIDENTSAVISPDDPSLPSPLAPAKTASPAARPIVALGLEKRPISNATPQEDIIVIPEELNQHLATFEIFLQTLISQALDNNFLAEIHNENDEYFVDSVKIMEDLTGERKLKMHNMISWPEAFWESLERWPSVNVMSSRVKSNCETCFKIAASKLALFYGQPYDELTLKPKEDPERDAPSKNFNVCEPCAKLCELYNTLCHRKYAYYNECKKTVTNIRMSQPSKNTTTILRELLSIDSWITGLFRSMCTTFVRVDRMFEEHESQPSPPNTSSSVVKPEQSASAPTGQS